MRATRLLTALAAVAVLTGCSDGSPSATPDQTATSSPTPEVTSTAPSALPTSASPSPEDELSPKPALESPAPLGQPVCKGSSLTVVDADTLADPQHTREVYAVRTNGPDCQLEGYPTVTFQDASGRRLPISVQRSGFGIAAQEPEPVTLSRSTSVSFEIGSARSGSCTSITHVTVTLPGTSPGHRISSRWQVCNNKVAISPVQRRGDIH